MCPPARLPPYPFPGTTATCARRRRRCWISRTSGSTAIGRGTSGCTTSACSRAPSHTARWGWVKRTWTAGGTPRIWTASSSTCWARTSTSTCAISMRCARTRARFLNLQRGRKAFKIGKAHYDIGNDLFTAMLGKRLVYSCGYWKDAANLDDAQEAKLDLVCRKLRLEPGMRVLDIG